MSCERVDLRLKFRFGDLVENHRQLFKADENLWTNAHVVTVRKRHRKEIVEVNVADEPIVKSIGLDGFTEFSVTDVYNIVCVQVNTGPLEYAKAFLEPQTVLELLTDKVQDLKDTFKEFITTYFDALRGSFLKMCRELSECIESDSLWIDVFQSCSSPGNDSRTLFTAISGASHDSSNA